MIVVYDKCRRVMLKVHGDGQIAIDHALRYVWAAKKFGMTTFAVFVNKNPVSADSGLCSGKLYVVK